jgi:hypothetical protein
MMTVEVCWSVKIPVEKIEISTAQRTTGHKQ